jgi:CRISPR system Cascade subunit CasD
VSGFILHFAGPLQSWGEHSAFGERDTAAQPTRSGVVGLLAGALGLARGADLSRFRELAVTVRVDRPGVRIQDFHTAGGGYPQHRTPPTAEGKRRGDGSGTIVSRRHYLADAAFTVAVDGPPEVVDTCTEALRTPGWAPFLGRRSCPPAGPLVLRTQLPDAAAELDRVPLARRKPFAGDTVRVLFSGDRPTPGTAAERQSVTSYDDDPVSFANRNRVYRSRVAYQFTRELPAGLCGGYGTDYLDRLETYLSAEVGA